MPTLKTAILFSKKDREDGWVTGLVFPVTASETYLAAYEELKEILESKEVVDKIIKDNYLDDEGRLEGFTFSHTEFNYGPTYIFKNEDGEELDFQLSCDFTSIVE